jgi:hypothetical protein
MVFSPLFGFSNTAKLPASHSDSAPVNNVVQPSADKTADAAPTVRNLKASDNPKQDSSSHADSMTPSFVSVGVNPSTLDATANISLGAFSLGSTTGFSLSLSYNEGKPSLYGSPNSWSYSVPYIYNGMLSYNGAQFAIDDEWADSKGYHSGLRYMNNPGIKFKNLHSQIDLPSYMSDSRQYQYELDLKDGGVYYFGITGKIYAISDRYDNYILFNYDNQESPSSSRLTSIQDSLGKELKFIYGSQQEISYSQSSSLGDIVNKVGYGPNGVLKYTDSIGNSTALEYINNPSGSGYVISKVTEPSGLETQLYYGSMPYKGAGGTGQLAVVSRVYKKDLSTGKDLGEVEYSFGQSTSGNNYTGYPDYPMLADTSSPLMASGNDNYKYDITTTVKSDGIIKKAKMNMMTD